MRFKANPTTGYSWKLKDLENTNCLKFVSSTYEEASKAGAGKGFTGVGGW